MRQHPHDSATRCGKCTVRKHINTPLSRQQDPCPGFDSHEGEDGRKYHGASPQPVFIGEQARGDNTDGSEDIRRSA